MGFQLFDNISFFNLPNPLHDALTPSFLKTFKTELIKEYDITNETPSYREHLIPYQGTLAWQEAFKNACDQQSNQKKYKDLFDFYFNLGENESSNFDEELAISLLKHNLISY